MSDNIEKFIRKNRRDFDAESPSENLWSKIESTLPRKHAKRFSLRDVYKWSAAAAIFFVLLTSAYFLLIRKNSHEDPQSKTEIVKGGLDDARSYGDYAPLFTRAYQTIAEQQKQLRAVTAGNPELYKQFRADLGALDSSYQMLKKQAENSPNRDVIIQAMMQNLRLQAELLGRQLMISTELNNNTKTSTNEKDI